ncbi:MAG: hypothetical protein JWO82_1868 [Akkermansiaceae bacterium]|nr:hypothetical protein [Akkermansiaceae bacterium]
MADDCGCRECRAFFMRVAFCLNIVANLLALPMVIVLTGDRRAYHTDGEEDRAILMALCWVHGVLGVVSVTSIVRACLRADRDWRTYLAVVLTLGALGLPLSGYLYLVWRYGGPGG